MREKFFYRFFKRSFDVFFAYIFLTAAYLPMMFIALAVKCTSPGSAVFKQKRVGREGKIFVCYKFRTMYREAPDNLSTAEFSDAGRFVTPVGKFLRRTSLDELPQLLNVLAGDMSIIGPRPLIPREKVMHEKRRNGGAFDVRPGISGLAQISGRDILDDEKKAALDIEYVARMSMRRDFFILMKTVARVIWGRGICMGGEEKSGVGDIRQ